jgi:hypothetical protein
MRINKKLILILVIVFSVVGIIYFFLRKSEQKPATPPLPTPKISSNYKGKFDISLLLDKENFDLPEKISLLETTPTTLNEDHFKKIAKNLGFQGEPLEMSDVFDGKTYFWKNDNYSFFVFSQKGKLRYSKNIVSIAINKQLSDEAIESLATSFLVENEVVDPNNISLSKIRYLKETEKYEGYEEAEKEKATVFEVSFNYKAAGYEILTPQYVEPIVYVRLGLDGSVQSFQFIDIADLKNTPKEYRLKDYQETKEGLGEAVLIGLQEKQVALKDLAINAIKNIDVDKITLGYLYDPGKSTVLQPIYILNGDAKVEGYTEKISVSLYLPALSSNQP